MEKNLYVSMLAAILSAILSVVIPCLLDRNSIPLMSQIKQAFENKRKDLLKNSLITFVVVYASFMIADELGSNNAVNIKYLSSLRK